MIRGIILSVIKYVHTCYNIGYSHLSGIIILVTYTKNTPNSGFLFRGYQNMPKGGNMTSHIVPSIVDY